MNIGYVNFSKDDFGYGLSYIMHKNNIKAIPATLQTAPYFDVLLFSIFWWEHVYDFYDFCIRAGIGNKKLKPLIIVGGFNAFNPKVFIPYAHRVVVGDGENCLIDAIEGNFNPSIYTGTETEVTYATCPIENNDYVYPTSKIISRIEIARGCKYRCKFCQLTWLKKYREVGLDVIKNAIDNVKTKSVALFAPNGPSHSKYREIQDYCRVKKLNNVAADVRYNEIHYYDNQQTPTIGLEGMSYDLRKSVGKPIRNEDFAKKLFELFDRQIKKGYKPAFHTYIILDLPGEKDSDFDEYIDLMYRLEDYHHAKEITWFMTANVFMPAPFTPMEDEVVHIERDYRAIWKAKILDDRMGYRRATIYPITGRHSIFSPYSRLLSMIATKGGEEAYQIIEQIVCNKLLKRAMVGKWDKALDQLSFFLERNFDGIEKYTGKPNVKPWDIVKVDVSHRKQTDTIEDGGLEDGRP